MDDHLVEVAEPHPLQRLIDGLRRILVGLQLCRDLAGDEKLFPANAAGAHALADAAFVSVGLRGVDQAIAQLYRLANGFRRLGIVDEPGAQSQLGNLDSV